MKKLILWALKPIGLNECCVEISAPDVTLISDIEVCGGKVYGDNVHPCVFQSKSVATAALKKYNSSRYGKMYELVKMVQE